jgi:hypothetical protein
LGEVSTKHRVFLTVGTEVGELEGPTPASSPLALYRANPPWQQKSAQEIRLHRAP